MKFFREIAKSYRDTKYLKKRYRGLTASVGVLGVLVGTVILFFASVVLATTLGIGSDDCIKCHEFGWIWLTLFFIGIPVTFYLGAVIVASILSSFMVLGGKFTVSEAINYTLYSKYPDHWFDENA